MTLSETPKTQDKNLAFFRDAITGQPEYTPPAEIRGRVMAVVTAASLKRSRRTTVHLPSSVVRPPSAASWAWGMGLALAVFVLLWAAIKPGVVLQWALNNGGVTAFQVYRAAEGSDEFILIGEVPTQAGADRYTFVDALSMPAANYTYVVKGVKRSGEATLSQAINASTAAALPSQVGILLASLIIGGGAAILARERQFYDWGGGGLVS